MKCRWNVVWGLTLLLFLFSGGCGSNQDRVADRSSLETLLAPDAPLSEDQQAWVDETLSELTVSEMAAQVLMPHMSTRYTPVDSEAFDRDAALVNRGVGGLGFYGGPPHARVAKTNELQRRAEVPLLVNGAALGWGPLYGGGTDLPPAIAYGAIGDEDAVREAGQIVGVESRTVGAHVVHTLPSVTRNLSTSLVFRTFGGDPEKAGRLAAAFIEGAHEEGALSYASTFPGGGALSVDPHVRLPILEADRRRLDTLEWVPFEQAIVAGTDLVMTSHIALPAVTGSDSLPVTLSADAIRALRDDLGFQGVVITDAMGMGAITNNYGPLEAAVRAFEAGHDLILGPERYVGTEVADSLTAAVRAGEIPEERLRASVRRILEAKARLGLHQSRTVSLEAVDEVVGRRAHQQAAELAAARSVVLLRDREQRVPLSSPSDLNVLSVTLAREDNERAGRTFNRILEEQVESVEVVRISPFSGSDKYEELHRRAREADVATLSVYLRPGAFFEHTELPAAFVRAARRLRDGDTKTVLLSFGKVDLLDALPDLQSFLLAWSGQDVMQRAAAQALLGRAEITGTLPMSLDPYHERGEGLRRTARDE